MEKPKPREIVGEKIYEDLVRESNFSNIEYMRKTAIKDFPQFFQFEIEKNIKEVQEIKNANERIDVIAKKYQKDVINLEPQDIHKIPANILQSHIGENVFAVYVPQVSQIFYTEADEHVFTMHNLHHELLHAKSMNLFQVTQSRKMEKTMLTSYRSGVSVFSRDGHTAYFYALNEAITEYIAKRVTQTAVQESGIAEKRDDLLNQYNILATYHKYPIKNKDETLMVEVMQTMQEGRSLRQFPYAYEKSRALLEMILTDVEKAKNLNRKEVEDVFFEAYFTGRFHKLRGVIDEVYGKGTFLKMGRIDRFDVKKIDFNAVDKRSLTLYSLLETLKSQKNETQY